MLSLRCFDLKYLTNIYINIWSVNLTPTLTDKVSPLLRGGNSLLSRGARLRGASADKRMHKPAREALCYEVSAMTKIEKARGSQPTTQAQNQQKPHEPTCPHASKILKSVPSERSRIPFQGQRISVSLRIVVALLWSECV